MFKTIKNAFLLLCYFTLFFGGLYPCIVFLIGTLFFPFQAGGSLIFHRKTQSFIGSQLIAQEFKSTRYFHSRPSETKKGHYNGLHSGSSELGPTIKRLIETIASRTENYRVMNSLSPDICVPIDAVAASSSGLDPHISVSNALLQAPRVAKARKISEDDVHVLIQQFTERPSFGLLGEARVNVLLLNLRLDNSIIEMGR